MNIKGDKMRSDRVKRGLERKGKARSGEHKREGGGV